MPHDRVRKVVHPVVLVCVARERVPGPMMEGVDALPQARDHVKGPVHPIHPEGQDVVVAQEAQHPLVPRRHRLSGRRIVAGECVVEAEVERELTHQGHAVVPHEGLKLLQLSATQVLLRLQGMLARRLNPVLGAAEEHGLEIGVVDAGHRGLRPQQRRHLFQRHGPRHIDLLRGQQGGRGGEARKRAELEQGQRPLAAEEQGGEMVPKAKAVRGVSEGVGTDLFRLHRHGGQRERE
mmetsp:Transcript_94784/g.274064  ORF Transcript_94784/g.274064 Transcript_94784/m.274064 type:complete len:236 (+) Transcript_94784:623-1330(+)